MRITDFFFESAYQIVTWVFIGASIASLVTCLSIGNGKGALISSIALFVCILLMLGLVARRFTNRPQFSVVGEDWLSGTAEPDRISYFVVPNYPRNTLTASRITDLRYVRLTNEGPRPLMVDFLAVEISKDGKNWNPTTLIDISNGQLFFPNVKEGLKKCLRVKLDKPELKTMTFDKNIGSGETVKGWLCIARPTGSGFDMTKWRIRIRDNKGEQGISEVTGVGKRSDNETFSGTGLTFNENDDLTGIQFTFYNQ